jgi:hypothetical protein
MIIETTTRFEDRDEAEDSLAGLSSLQSFYAGYVRQNPDQSCDVVTIFDCLDVPTQQTLRRQKPVTAVVIGTAARDVLFYERRR